MCSAAPLSWPPSYPAHSDIRHFTPPGHSLKLTQPPSPHSPFGSWERVQSAHGDEGELLGAKLMAYQREGVMFGLRNGGRVLIGGRAGSRVWLLGAIGSEMLSVAASMPL